MRKAILVGVNTNHSNEGFKEALEECVNLCEACKIEVIEQITQKTNFIDRKTCVGSGKIEEIIERVEETEVDALIFYNDLSISQVSNIQAACEVDVIDRTTLILDIFAIRARTREAQLQIEMARLKYDLPRLIAQDYQGDQQRGGSGVKNRGQGETHSELMRRDIERQLSHLKKELESLVVQTEVQKTLRQKSKLPIVALVGYTNAGKSSLMNAILKDRNASEDKQVIEKDMLFATLDTSIRRVSFESGKEFLLFDTVGFVSDLPTELVEAFKSTLTAAKEADLLIHVIDAHSESNEAHQEATMKTLKRIQADTIPMIKVYNKADLVIDKEKTDGLYTSCKNNEGIKELLKELEDKVYPRTEELNCLIPYANLAIISTLKKDSDVEIIEDNENGRVIHVKCNLETRIELEKYKI